MKKFVLCILLIITLSLSLACCAKEKIPAPEVPLTQGESQSLNESEVSTENKETTTAENQRLTDEKIAQILLHHSNQVPKEWGEKITSVVNTFQTEEKAVALTLDACGGPHGSGFDKELIDFLKNESIPATLFINRKWIENNKELFLELSKDSNFEIENHGYEHRGLCVTPKEIYGINGTSSPQGVVNEIKYNEDYIFSLTGRRTKFFRSGTAYYDEVAVSIANDMGYCVAGFNINGDGGASFSVEQIHTAMKRVKSGDIIISHFNQPDKNTFEGLREPLLQMKNQGYRFVKLEDVIK